MRIAYRGGLDRLENDGATRVWQIWPSSGNIILFEGICITGQHPILLFVILLCATFPYFSFMLNYDQGKGFPLSVWFLTIWFVITALLVLKVSLSDPGIIPRRAIAERMYAHVKDRNEAESLINPYAHIPGSIFCYTCEIMRPPLASHCSDCGNCILGLDHHCAVLNNCIGQRNYPFFLMLLPSVFFFTISFIFQIRLPGYSDAGGANHGTIYSIIVLISMTIAVLSFIFVCGLLLYHSWLVYTKKTTRQHIRGTGAIELSLWERLKGHAPLFTLRDNLNISDQDEHFNP